MSEYLLPRGRKDAHILEDRVMPSLSATALRNMGQCTRTPNTQPGPSASCQTSRKHPNNFSHAAGAARAFHTVVERKLEPQWCTHKDCSPYPQIPK